MPERIRLFNYSPNKTKWVSTYRRNIFRHRQAGGKLLSAMLYTSSGSSFVRPYHLRIFLPTFHTGTSILKYIAATHTERDRERETEIERTHGGGNESITHACVYVLSE